MRTCFHSAASLLILALGAGGCDGSDDSGGADASTETGAVTADDAGAAGGDTSDAGVDGGSLASTGPSNIDADGSDPGCPDEIFIFGPVPGCCAHDSVCGYITDGIPEVGLSLVGVPTGCITPGELADILGDTAPNMQVLQRSHVGPGGRTACGPDTSPRADFDDDGLVMIGPGLGEGPGPDDGAADAGTPAAGPSETSDGPTCEAWRRAAEALAACDPQVLPPMGPEGQLECWADGVDLVSPVEYTLAEPAPMTLGECVDFLEGLREGLGEGDQCVEDARGLRVFTIADPEAEPRLARLFTCTYGAVARWEPTVEETPCETWKRVAAARAACDPAHFVDDYADAECIDDAEVAARYEGFDSVADCARYLSDNSFPCTIPDETQRDLCSELVR